MDSGREGPGPQEMPIAAQIAHPAPRPAPPRRRSPLRVLIVLGLFGLAGMIALTVMVSGLSMLFSFDTDQRVRETHFSHLKKSDNKIVIISVEGTILSGERGFAKRQIDQAMDDPTIRAIVLRVNSPGGTVTGSDYIYHHLCKLADSRKPRIPIVVSMGGLAASGGYYISMAVGDTPDSIFAEPTTWTGSIGVIIPHYDLSELLEKNLGIKQDSIISDRFKGMGSFSKAMSTEERAILQELVDESFGRFKTIIQEGRPKFRDDEDALEELATGQVFTATQAEKSGLIDKIGFIEAAVDRAIELAGLEEDDVTVVKYRREPGLVSLFMGTQANNRSFDLAKMLDMTSPRAYYLSTWLPPLVESAE